MTPPEGLLLIVAVMFVAFLLRHQVGPRVTAALVAAGFGMTTAAVIWRLEWFSVYRLGMPPLGYLLQSIVAYTVVLSIAGWVVGRGISKIPALHPRSAPRERR